MNARSCATCHSTGPRRLIVHDGQGVYPCPDPWHDGTTPAAPSGPASPAPVNGAPVTIGSLPPGTGPDSASMPDPVAPLRRAADMLLDGPATHSPGPLEVDGITYCGNCRWVWPCPPVQAATVATIEVMNSITGRAYPIVERVPGGWQSGAHHYPDAAVLAVTPRPTIADIAEPLATALRHAATAYRALRGSQRGPMHEIAERITR